MKTSTLAILAAAAGTALLYSRGRNALMDACEKTGWGCESATTTDGPAVCCAAVFNDIPVTTTIKLGALSFVRPITKADV